MSEQPDNEGGSMFKMILRSALEKGKDVLEDTMDDIDLSDIGEFAKNKLTVLEKIQLPTDLLKGVSSDMLDKIPLNVRDLLADGMPKEISPDILQQLPVDVIKKFPMDTLTRLPEEIRSKLPKDFQDSISKSIMKLTEVDFVKIPNNLFGDIPFDVLEKVPTDIKDLVAKGGIAELSSGDIVRLPVEVLNKFPVEDLGHLPDDLAKKLPKSVRDKIKQSLPSIAQSAMSIFPADFKPLPKQNIFLGEIVSKGVFGKLFPFLMVIGFGVAGFFGGIYEYQDNWIQIFLDTDSNARIFTYWAVFLGLGAFMLAFYGAAINIGIQQTHKMMDVKQKQSKRWQGILMGPIGEISILVIAAPFIYFDMANFEAQYGVTLLAVNAVSISWFIILIISWVYFIAFIWLSLGFLIYMARALRKTTWRMGIERVLETKQYRKLINIMIMVYLPLVPYIVLKFLFQIYILPTATDEIASFTLAGLFFGGIITGPALVSRDVKKEKVGFLSPKKDAGIAYVKNMTQKILNKEEISQNDMFQAMLVNMNSGNMTAKLKEKVMDSALVKKLIAMMSGPAIAYLLQFVQGDGVLADILGFLGVGI